MKFTKPLLAAAPVALAAVVAGCGGGAYGKSSSAPAGGTSPAKPAAGTTVSLEKTKLGPVLVDGRGRTMYLFEADQSTQSTCYTSCASIWPPVTTTGTPKAGAGVVAARLGTTKRTDGTTELTYGGHPLYYYVGDTHAGSTTGQGLNQFGAKWYVVGANGRKIDND